MRDLILRDMNNLSITFNGWIALVVLLWMATAIMAVWVVLVYALTGLINKWWDKRRPKLDFDEFNKDVEEWWKS